MSIARGLLPPSLGGGKVYPVVWPAQGAPLDLTLLDVAFTWIPVHWVTDPVIRRRRSLLCQSWQEWCRCETMGPLSWRGYCPAWSHRNRFLCVLNVDPATAPKLSALVGPSARLLGSRFFLARAGKDNYGAVTVSVPALDAYKWEGPAPDISSTLVRYYGSDIGPVLRRVAEEGGEPV